MFRGVLYQRYRETRGFYYAAIWSALFFSVTHTNTVQMIYTFLLGILLCYVYEKFGSMKAPIMLHIVLNLGSLIFTDIGVFMERRYSVHQTRPSAIDGRVETSPV